jgi:type II secretory ATPase GspE/PulE/Tfp pilus assembly ATPase PilB-like protein
VPPDVYLTTCWNCLGEFDAVGAVWCSDDPKNPTKLCPFCFRCFCDASERYKRDFWRQAPLQLQEELQILTKSKDKLGDILIRMKKITIPQLLDALNDQRTSGRRLGEILVAWRLVRAEDIQAALKTQGANPLTDTMGQAYAASPVWDQSEPDAIIQYILSLAARKGASDVHLEPNQEAVAVKYRIDGFFFRVDPIPRTAHPGIVQRLSETFRLDPARADRPQTGRTTARLGDVDFEMVLQVLPTPHGPSATIKLLNRATYLKDFATLGLELEDRVRLMEELRNHFGLFLVAAPVFNGGNTTAYSIMSFLVQGPQREVVSLEAPIHWSLEGVKQIEVESDRSGVRMEEALRSVLASRPEVVVVSSIPDAGTALLSSQLSSSILVVGQMTAQSAILAITAFHGLGIPPSLLAGTLLGVTCQRLVRQICRICRQEVAPPAAQTLALRGISADEAEGLRFYKGKGCPTCNTVGYRGRRGIFEVLTVSPDLRSALQAGAPAAELLAIAQAEGMRTLREQCLGLLREGVTTFEELVRLRL